MRNYHHTHPGLSLGVSTLAGLAMAMLCGSRREVLKYAKGDQSILVLAELGAGPSVTWHPPFQVWGGGSVRHQVVSRVSVGVPPNHGSTGAGQVSISIWPHANPKASRAGSWGEGPQVVRVMHAMGALT